MPDATKTTVRLTIDGTPISVPKGTLVIEAARRIGIDARHCWYVGDDQRDVQAGRAAGMTTVVAAWGYLGAGEPLAAWGADHIIQSPVELLNLWAIA